MNHLEKEKDGKRVARLIIDDAEPMSWNKLYEAPHWSIRNDEAARVHQLVRIALDPDRPMFKGKVRITVIAYLKDNRSLKDPCNIMGKIYIDGIVGWLIEDDSYKYVDAVTTKRRLDRENPRVEMVIEEV